MVSVSDAWRNPEERPLVAMDLGSSQVDLDKVEGLALSKVSDSSRTDFP